MALVVSGVAGLLRCLLEGKLNVNDVSASVVYIFSVSQVFYATYGKKLTEGIEFNFGNVDPTAIWNDLFNHKDAEPAPEKKDTPVL
jgi:hypothetical protein